jgi:hypothetical protein
MSTAREGFASRQAYEGESEGWYIIYRLLPVPVAYPTLRLPINMPI